VHPPSSSGNSPLLVNNVEDEQDEFEGLNSLKLVMMASHCPDVVAEI